MVDIRPISDLRNKFREIEETLENSSSPIFLTKNGYGTMVLMSIDMFSELTNNIEKKLDQADYQALSTTTRLSKDQIFDKVRKNIDEQSL